MPGHARRLVPLLAAVALSAAACGGGEPSADEFAAEANAICEEHRSTIETAANEVLASGQLGAEFGRLVQETIIPETSQQLERLAELDPPDEVAVEFEAYLDEAEQAVAQIREDPTFLTDPSNFAEVNEQADAAGLSDACGIGPGAPPG